jgi:ribonuclease HI
MTNKHFNNVIKWQKNDKKIITIYTDAGFCYKTQIASWACFIKTDGFNHSHDGVIKENCKNPLQAEIKAIGNAIFIAGKLISGINNYHLVVVTDSQASIDYFENKVKRKFNNDAYKITDNKQTLDLVASIKSRITSSVSFKKVKAHSNNDGKRSYINSKVDAACKINLAKAKQNF